MALTSTEVAELLGITTASAKYSQITYLLPYITVQINDYCAGGFSRQVKEESETFTAATSTAVNQLAKYPVVKGTVYVTSTDRGTVYYGDTQFGNVAQPDYYLPTTYARDYDLDYSTGGIYVASTNSQISSTGSVLVTYSFVDLVDGGKVAASRMIDQAISQSAGINSESVGSLSRSYNSYGMDNLTKSILAPYKRPKVI